MKETSAPRDRKQERRRLLNLKRSDTRKGRIRNVKVNSNAMDANFGTTQGSVPDSPTDSLDSTARTGKSGGDAWQEDVYQKIKSMKESYLPEFTEMQQELATIMPKHEPLPNQPESDQFVKAKKFKKMFEGIIAFLRLSKGDIVPSLKDNMASCEKLITEIINTCRSAKAAASVQLGQIPTPHMHPVSQPLPQLAEAQSTKLLSSEVTMPQNNIASLQHNSLSSISGVSATQQNIINSMQPGANSGSSLSVNSQLNPLP